MDFEKTWNYETGIYYRIGDNFDNRLIGYYSYIHDYLLIDRVSYEHGYYGWNIDTVKLYGIEYEFNATIQHLSVFGNYTYKDHEVKEDDPDKLTGFWVNLPPKHSAKVSFRYSLSDTITLTWDQRYVGKRQSEHGFDLDSYNISDVGTQYSFLAKKAKVLLYVKNLFGESYQEVYGYPMPRQTCGLQLKFSFF